MAINIIKCMATKNECYNVGKYITPKRIIIHSTGAANKTLRRYVQPNIEGIGNNPNNNSFNICHPGGKDVAMHSYQSNGTGKCKICGGSQVFVHGFIGLLADNKTIACAQIAPWNMRVWGCGSGKNGSYNDDAIQIEICEDDKKDKAYLESVWQYAIELCAYLCNQYNIGFTHCISHKEGYLAGKASNHGDPEHWFSLHGKTMKEFRLAVQKAMQTKPVENSTPEPPIYRLRKSWEDSKSQLGAYSDLEVAIKAFNEANPYTVYDSKGKKVYP